MIMVCVLPPLLKGYVVSIFIFVGIYSIVAIGLGLLLGWAGQISMGHGAFMGIGAYTSGVLSFRYGISPWLGIICGMVITGSIAYAIGKAILHFRGHVLGVVTCALGLIFYSLFGEMDFITGGYDGFSRIPRLSIGGFVFVKDIHFFYLLLVIFSILFVVASNIAKSKIGNEFRTIDLHRGGSEVAAETLGINIGKIKTQAFVLSAVYASIGGSLYAHYVTHLDPTPFSLWTGFMMIIIVVIGGARSLWGPVLGAAFYFGLKELISVVIPTTQSAALAGIEVILFSLFFILALLFSPDGLVQIPTVLRQFWVERTKRRGS